MTEMEALLREHWKACELNDLGCIIKQNISFQKEQVMIIMLHKQMDNM